MKPSYQKNKKNSINMDGEITKLQELFGVVEDKRASNSRHKLDDMLMIGYAMFSLKHPSLHSFIINVKPTS